MNILDFITAGIIIACVMFCTWRGLLLSLYNSLSLFITFILARQLYPFLSALLKKTPLYGALNQTRLSWLDPVASDTSQVVTNNPDNNVLPGAFEKVLLENAGDGRSLDLTNVGVDASNYIAGMIIDALAIMIVFFAVFIILRIVAKFIRNVFHLTVVSTFNRIGGAMLGLAVGAIFSWLTLSIMKGIFSSSIEFPVMDLLAESLMARFFMFS